MAISKEVMTTGWTFREPCLFRILWSRTRRSCWVPWYSITGTLKKIKAIIYSIKCGIQRQGPSFKFRYSGWFTNWDGDWSFKQSSQDVIATLTLDILRPQTKLPYTESDLQSQTLVPRQRSPLPLLQHTAATLHFRCKLLCKELSGLSGVFMGEKHRVAHLGQLNPPAIRVRWE